MSLPRPAALLFDLDGTLVDSRRDIAAALNVALGQLGRAPLPLEMVLPMVGDGARMLVMRALLVGEDAPAPEALVDRGLTLYNDAYLAAPCVHTVVLPGVMIALALGLPTALVTNKPRNVSLALLDALGLRDAFGAIYASGDGPLKPAPDGIRTVCRAIAVSPSDTWMIGDGPQDVLAARNAGATAIAVAGIAEREAVLAAGPHVVLTTLEELPPLLSA